ncbi:XylR family transcriptional regulator [Terrimonas pollutisoli]|uniref:XylR family transcriptional regulator n=1 Tax=Terrimonas pollutisoli TaxID=3034147 RepID=UPI0023EDAA48|nr:XylR family transcriptional regulator [Terrimonas sp. H1YJ31]
MKNKLKLVVLLDASRAYDRDLLTGITNYNKLHDKFVFFFHSPKYIHDENVDTLFKRIIDWKPDGIFTREIGGLKKLLGLNIPIIIAPHTKLYKDHINLWGDENGIGRMVGEHFIKKGYKNFAFLGFKDFQWSLERQAGFVEYLQKNGHVVSEFIFDNNKMLWESLPAKFQAWLKTLAIPCAVFAATDELNVPLLEAAHTTGLKVPGDISIIGVDNDTMICEMSNPTLSSVSHNAVQAGFQAALALSRWMEYGQKPAANIMMEVGTIITRNSTNALALDDEHVRTALHYIANMAASEDISVEDVVKATVVSRRVLEKKFQTVIKSSILEEIKRVRIERIKFLLGNSDLSVQQIAFELNFRNFENITRYFKQYTGLKPLEYRNKMAKS